jgi:hypothetical protein
LFFSLEDDLITCFCEFRNRKLGVIHFGFLHAKHVRAIFFKPGDDDVEAGPDGVHIVGRNPECVHETVPDLVFTLKNFTLGNACFIPLYCSGPENSTIVAGIQVFLILLVK